ncbi:MAG TPA: dihydrolipoyl dehydrogenase [Clostridiaceae bacterium]|nr:dihydrolipoyl dehydrogenase [Clostridiaceae bacterium]HBF76995.1 dihydrolipoyl dehydrogenase [Clostridiaceae bacterium]HBG38435.1 dihydrolipoyl dehydrogenase [Clostridiaceae bacterium]HBN28683.1 dihydrolipoyl dehydrogenase [Clostridiaceae bacterium]HBX47453.1 dihydrolipoyl dehydrogenase [Clostridiaceae bacterium]
MDKDIVVIGGGPGGYVAAIRAAQLGAKVALIEKDKLGGTCLNRGCIPTKTLYRDAEILNTLKKVDSFGINVDGFSIDVEKMQERKDLVVVQLRDGIANLLKANGVEVYNGFGKIKGKNTVEVSMDDGAKDISTKNIIIATGSKPSLPPIEGADLPNVYSSEDMLNFKAVPKKLLIVGGGVIGMEFAGIFNSMGSKVTVVEFMPRILLQTDTDITKRFSVLLKKKGIDVYVSTRVNKIEKSGDGFLVHTENKKGETVFEADNVLIATGRSPLIEGLNIEGVGIKFDKKGIKVDENYMTSVENIYAIGDVNGISMLAHAASNQGVQTAEKIMGIDSKGKHNPIPSCIFVFPEIASVGVTEDEAKEKGIKYKTSKSMFGGNGKALALGEPEGLVKVIASEDDTIIGVHIMGPHASDLINEGNIAVSMGMKASEVGSIIHAHPTLSETFHEAVLGINGSGIHTMPIRKRV